MAATVRPFTAVSNAVSSPQQWTGISEYGIEDPTTGDWVTWSYANNTARPIAMITSQDKGVTWNRVATDATNPITGSYDKIQGVVQDANGAVHCYTYDGSVNGSGYGRLTLVRTSGHVTGYTWAVKPFAVPGHSTGYGEVRGSIYLLKLNGVDTVVYAYLGSTSSTDLLIYAARATSLTPANAAAFVGLDGTGSDSLLTSLTDATGYRWGHTHCCALGQNKTTEDLSLMVGPFDNDQASAPQSTLALDDLWARQLPRSGSNWTVGSATSVGTTIVAAATGVPMPNLLCVRGNTSVVMVMYTDGTNGVCFATISSTGTVTPRAIASPLSTAGRNGFGVFSLSNTGEVHAVVNTYGGYGVETPTGKLLHYDPTSSTWDVSTTDATAATCVAIIGFSGVTNGIAAVRVEGDPVSQTVTGVLKGAAVYTPAGSAVSLAAAAAGQDAATASLLKGVSIAAAAVSLDTATAGMSHAVPLGANAVAQVTASGQVNLSVRFGTNAISAAVATALMSVAKPLAVAAASQAAATADLSALAGGSTVNLAATAASLDAAAADLAKALGLSAPALSSSATTADLAKSLGLSAAVLSATAATADVSKVVSLAAAATSQSTALSTLDVKKLLGAAAGSQAGLTAMVALVKGMAADAAGQDSAAAALDVSAANVVNLTAAATTFATSGGTLSLGVNLSAGAVAQVLATATLGGSAGLAAAAIANAQASAAVAVGKPLSAAGQSQATASTTVWLQVKLNAVAMAEVLAGGALNLTATLSAAAISNASGSATIAGPVNLTGAGLSVSTGGGALSVQPLTNVLKHSRSAADRHRNFTASDLETT